MIITPRQALDFLRRRRLVTMRSLVDEIAGEKVKGSWWGHPKGRLIYALAESVHKSKDVLTAKLVDGKVTFIDRALWPALARVVMDADGRGDVSPAARKLLREVERKGRVRLEKAATPAARELERSLLLHIESVHTEKGSHASVLTAWKKVFDKETKERAKKLSLEQAIRLLGLAPIP